MNKNLFVTAVLLASALTQGSAQTETRQLSIDTKTLGIEISPTLSGIFFEDINQSLDGGICAQMIQNNSFQAYNVPDGPANEFSQSDTIFFGWTVVSKDGAVGQAHAVSDYPLVKLERKYDYDPNDKYDDELRYIQYCVRFDIQKAGAGYGIAANGYGITPSTRDRGAIYSNNTQRPSLAVEAGVSYDLGLYLQGEKYKGKVSVWLEDIDGQVNSNVITLSKLKNEWQKYTGSLKALRTKDSRLMIVGDKEGSFFLDFVTLLPEASKLWNNGKNGPLRKDLMEALAALHPKFMRFPGGCASEGPNYFGQVFWKNSVGKPEERLGFRNHWGYWTSQYVGFYEYFLMAESLGASPLPVLNNGVTCQFVGHSYIAPLETEADRKRFHDIFVKDALDLIEFCNGPVTSTWGKLRAEMGHPAPFNLKYLGVGNENQGKEFWERFDIIYKAIKAQYPDIIIVSTAGARDAGREFDNNYAEIDAKYPDTYVDEHYYKGDDWFFSQGNRYAPDAKRGKDGLTYDRSRPTRVFVGEFANNNTNNAYRSTLAEAAYWLSLERNSDMVVMAAYAPLFCKKGYNKWNSNLIWFDNRGLWRTTNYYYQQLFSLGGNRALKYQDVMNGNEADTKIYTSPTIDTQTGTIYLKFVNAEAKDKQISVSLNTADTYNAEIEYITSHDTNVKNQGDQNYYSSHPDVPADFSYAEAITPQTKSLGTVKSTFTFTMPENAVGVLRLNRTVTVPVTNISLTNGPQLLSDNSVKFTVRAPEAQKVQVDLGGTKYDMTKGDNGTWTVQTKPQVPGFHYYSLIIDGVSVADPASQSFYGCSRWSSAIEIPEQGMDDFEVQAVPHGEVRTVHYFSNVEKAWRPLMVYTPAGYNEGKQDYPVVYIQHGGGEDHRGWMEQGRTAQIMDNLIAAGKAVPMIVVSSNSNVRSTSGGFGGGGYSWQGMQTFRSELLESVIPFVEKTYRVKKDRKSRAMCGLSMGGGQSFYIGLRDPEVFANVGVFSTGMFGGIRGASDFDLEKEVPGMLTDTKTFNQQFDVFFLSCGEQDPRIEYTRNIVKKMRDGGVEVKFNSYPGDHEWQVWRKSLHEFVQYLFK